MLTLTKILEKQLWDISVKKYEKNNSLNSVLNLFNITYEILEEPFAKAAIDKNF